MTEIAAEGQRRLIGEAENLLQVARAMVINSDETYQDGADFCSAMLRRDKRVIDTFRIPKQKAWEAHKAVCNAENLHLGQDQAASEIVAVKMKDFHEKREAELQEAQRKEREIQERQEADHRRRQEEAARKIRKEEDRAREQKETRDKARREVEERKIEEARKADEAGRKQDADRILQEQIAEDKRKEAEEKRIKAERAEQAKRDQVRQQHEEAERREKEEADEKIRLAQGPKKAQADGAGMRTDWFAEVTDLKALCRAVGAGKAPLSSIQANTKVLDRMAKTLREELDIDGVEARSKTVMVRRS